MAKKEEIIIHDEKRKLDAMALICPEVCEDCRETIQI